MNLNKYNCIVCHIPFDDSIHLPRSLPHCPHIICTLCLSKSFLTKSKTFICPKDNKIYSNIDNIENFKINQTIYKSIIEQKKNNEGNIVLNDKNNLTKRESKKSVKTQKSSKTKLDTVSFTDTLLTTNMFINTNSNCNISNVNNNNNNINNTQCYVKKNIKFNKKIIFSDNSLICSIHSLPLNVICVTDLQRICNQCALNNLHLDHQIIKENKFIEYVDELVKVFQTMESNKNLNIDMSNIDTNIILEKIENKIIRSKNKIKKICIDLIENINLQYRQIEKFLDLRKNEIFTKFKFINYNINSLKESAENWMEIISNKLIEANKGSIEDINIDCLKLLDKDKSKDIFHLINIGKQLNERYDFIKETKSMIEKLNKFSQNGLNIVPNSALIESIKDVTTINEGVPKQNNKIIHNHNILTTMGNRDKNEGYKTMKINFNFCNTNKLETSLFKIEEDGGLVNSMGLTPLQGYVGQIKNWNSSKGYDNSLIENEQFNTINNLSNFDSGSNDIRYNINSNKVYSKKKLDNFYSKEYIINFKNNSCNDNYNYNKTKTQTYFYNTNKNNAEIYTKKRYSPENKLNLSGNYSRYNTQFSNIESYRFKGNIMPLSPINKKDMLKKYTKEKICDVVFTPPQKRAKSSNSMIINNINNSYKQDSTLDKNALSPQIKNDINLMTQQEFRTVEKYQNKKNMSYKDSSGNKSAKNKNKGNNKIKNKFTRCISCTGSLVNNKKNELNDVPIIFNSKEDKDNSPPKISKNNDINDISNITNKINKSTSNLRHINKSCSKLKTNFNNSINNNNNIKNPSCQTKDINELKEIINNQMQLINPCFNHIFMNGEGIQLLNDFFQKNKNKKFKEIKLIGCNLNDDDFSLLIKNFIENEIELGVLNATYNKIGDNSFKSIFEMIKKVKGLKNIFLYNNMFSRGFKDKMKNYDRDNSLYKVRLYL